MLLSRRYLLIVFLVFIGAIKTPLAQEIMINDTIDNDILYYNDKAYGVLIHNRGYGAFITFGKNTSAFRRVSWDISFKSLNHYKEIENFDNTYFQGARPFKYGKINNVFMLSGHRTIQKLIYDKPYWGGVEIRYFYSGGLNIAFAKPKYYYVVKEWISIDTYSQEIALFDMNTPAQDIIAPASFFTGLNETKILPGINLAIGMAFDFSRSDQTIRKVEVSGTLDISPFPISIMSQFEPEYLIFSLQAKYIFGSKFN